MTSSKSLRSGQKFENLLDRPFLIFNPESYKFEVPTLAKNARMGHPQS